jgi:hypothetical protein
LSLERPVDYWQDFGRRCAGHLQQQTTIPFRKGEMEGFVKRVLAQMGEELLLTVKKWVAWVQSSQKGALGALHCLLSMLYC